MGWGVRKNPKSGTGKSQRGPLEPGLCWTRDNTHTEKQNNLIVPISITLRKQTLLLTRRTSFLWSRAAVPNLFGTRDQFCGRRFFHGLGGWGDGFGMIQVHYIYCALYFYYYYTVICNEIIIQLNHNAESVGALSLFSLATR